MPAESAPEPDRGPEVRLRPLTVGDWPAVHAWARRPEVCRFQAWGPNTAEETRAFVQVAADAWQRRPQVRFVYAVLVGAAVAGSAELHLRGPAQGEIAYVVHPDWWGRGVATRAARELVTVGFHRHGLHRVFATCDPRNVASARVLQKLGMRHEGRMRETQLIRDGWRDSDLYAVLCHEWHG